LHGISNVARYEKTRDFMVNLNEFASISARFHSIYPVFRRHNREVVLLGNATPRFPVLAGIGNRRK
jgi:hypothetical protein